MFKRSICITCAVLLFAALGCAKESPDGHWEGAFITNNTKIGITLDLAKNAKSEWVASMGIPAENATGLVVQSVTVNGSSVSFVAVELMMSKFDLTLGAGGTMKGTITTQPGPITVQQGPISVEFKRTGEAKIELIPVSPAVSKELEGDWVAKLAGPGASFPMVFHFKNQPDKTVSATMDSPVRNAMAIPLNNVKQSGRNVEFGLKVANASFQGTLNAEGTELAGKFIHDGAGVALTLKRKDAIAADNPFVGTWKKNVAKSSPSQNPSESEITTGTIIENGLKFVTDTIAADGKTTHEEQVMIFDGKDYPSVKFPGATQNCSLVDDYGFVCAIKSGGQEMLKLYDLLSSDGRTGTVIYMSGNSPGRERVQAFVYDKQ
jgi:hypothetical protein